MDGRPVIVPAGRGRTLLATLLLRANRFVSVDELIDRLWDGEPPSPDRAKTTLQMVVTRLRQALGDANCVRTATGGYVVEVTPDQLDLTRFRSLAARHRYADALALWTGPALGNVASDALHRDDVAPLLEERLVVVEQGMEADLAAGLAGELVPELRGLTQEHPFRERFWVQLMLALHRSGQQAEALAAYREVSGLLAEDLGIDPSPALRELHQQLLSGDVPVPSGWKVLCQLPPDTGDFVGRDKLFDQVRDLLTAGQAVPIVVVSGAPGAGKSAFTVRTAHRLRDAFPDGQLFVRLDGAGRAPRDPAEVLGDLLTALGESVSALPDGLAARAAAFRTRVADRAVLIVLDDAASAEQVEPLLPGTARSAVLVSSRRQLGGLSGVRGLRLPPFDTGEALSLLTRMVGADRIAREHEAATVLAELCGGLPLALRVVGARLTARSSLPLSALATRLADERRRLDELATRDMEVRATFGPSYEALPPDAASAFRRLGVLGAADVASWVVTALTGQRDGDRLVEQLVEANLLDEVGVDATGEPRYRLHDLLAVYASELAEAEDPAEQTAAKRRYVEALCALTHRAWEQLEVIIDEVEPPPFELQEVLPADEVARLTANGPAWLLAEQLLLDRGARLCLREGWVDLAAGLVERAMRHLDVFYPLDHVIATLGELSVAARAVGDLRGSWVFANSRLLQMARLGVDDALLASIGECADAFAELGHHAELASVLAAQAHFTRVHTGKPALSLAERAVDAARVSGNEQIYLSALRELASMLADSDRYAEAVPIFDESLELASRLGAGPESQVQYRIALYAMANGDPERARVASDRAVELVDGMDDLRAIAYVTTMAGRVAAACGDGTTALVHAERAAQIFDQVNEGIGALGALATKAEAFLLLDRRDEVVRLVDETLVKYGGVGAVEHEERLRIVRAKALSSV
ncbi:AfsR/SARP family transcriptional regulator [Lentzea tibetensis]|uniref:AfsR/SARP family transcriptional regulator n=1 Tax=Lentzea tibetensis TaxID=2591470 RepID=UPI001C990726|nr:BTAD domain-containing putative transcriptional regulator [Lentzea tibetensis]